MATERLIIEIQTKGVRQVNRNMKRLRGEASKANKTLALLRSTLVVVAGARVIGRFLELSDTLTNVRNRLRLVTNSTEQLNAVQQRLFGISQQTRSSFEANAELFNRLARSTDGLGLTFNELLDVTKGINQAIAISGATAQEARNGLIQFSQGLAAGAIQGDELRSVVEQFPRLADAIAKEFSITAESTASSLGVTQQELVDTQKEVGNLTGGALIAFAKMNEGILKTPRVIKALQNELGLFDAQFSKIDITVSGAFQKFNNELTLFIGGISESIQLGKQMDIVLTVVAQNLGLITAALLGILAIGAFNLIISQVAKLGSTLGGVVRFLTSGFTAVGRVFIGAFAFLTKSVTGAVTAARFLVTAYATASKAIITQIGLLGTRFGLLRLAVITTWGNAMLFMRTAALATSRAVVVAFTAVPALFSAIVRGARAAVVGMALLTSVSGGLRGVFIGLQVAASGFLSLLRGGLVRLIPVVLSLGASMLAAFAPVLLTVAALVAAFFAVRFAIQKLSAEFGDLGDIFNKVIGGIFGLVDGLVDAFTALPDAIADIAISGANALISGFEGGINGVIELLNAIPGVEISPADIGRIENQFEGSAARVKDILSTNISEGVQDGFTSTDTFKGLEAVADQVKNLISGGFLPEDFDAAKLTALLDAQSGTAGATRSLSKDTARLAGKFSDLRAEVDPLKAGMADLDEAVDILTAKFGANFRETETGAETLRLVTLKVLGLKDAEFELAQQMELVTQATKAAGLSAAEASLARRKFALEATEEFDNALSSVFPLIKAMRELEEIQVFLAENTGNLAKSGIDAADAQQRLLRESFGLPPALAQVNEEIEALIANQDLLGLSSSDLEHEVRKLNIAFLETQRDAASGANRAFLKMIDDATDAAKFTEMVFTDAFQAIEDAVVKFVETGKFSINDFFRNFAAQLIRLGTQQAMAGIGGFFTKLLGGVGGFGAGGPSGSNIAGPGGLVTGLLGFQNGGSFTVGANTAAQSIPGIDNRLVAFRAQDGEKVSVTPRGGDGGVGGAPINQIFNIQTKDGDSLVRSQSQIQNRALAGLNQARMRR